MDNAGARDQDIAAALSKIVEMQRAIRRKVIYYSVWTGLTFLALNYHQLPHGIARRLTEIDPGAVARVHEVTNPKASEEALQEVCDKVASDAAFAQAIRAANIYRSRAGYSPLGPDGHPLPAEPPEPDSGPTAGPEDKGG